MPMAESLPADIQDLAFRHALPLDGGLDFRQHAERFAVSFHRYERQISFRRRAVRQR